jgi:hypothetical protein
MNKERKVGCITLGRNHKYHVAVVRKNPRLEHYNEARRLVSLGRLVGAKLSEAPRQGCTMQEQSPG